MHIFQKPILKFNLILVAVGYGDEGIVSKASRKRWVLRGNSKTVREVASHRCSGRQFKAGGAAAEKGFCP